MCHTYIIRMALLYATNITEFYMETKVYRHKKTGNYYVTVTTAIDTTNSRDGTEVIVYFRDDKFYVRELKEFMEKFDEA